MKIRYSRKFTSLPPYLFVEIDKKKKAAIERGVDIISLGVGDPDQPTPPHVIKAGQKALADPRNHNYPFGAGSKAFRGAIARWYQKRFGVELNPDNEICALIGSKEGIGHFPLAFIDPGDIVLIPEPGYPVYTTGTIFAGGTPYYLPLKEENSFLPDLDPIPEKIWKRSKILFINFPCNPTAGLADEAFFKDVVRLAKRYGVIVAHDAAYSEIYFEKKPISFLEIPGAKDVGVEFHSLSKTYNMTGWRIGWVCGNAAIIKAIATVKDNYDSGVFQAVQEAAVAALEGPQYCVRNMRQMYKERRDVFVDGLRKLGWKLQMPGATFYVWARTPRGFTSKETASKLLDEAGIISTPGNGMGPSGEGFIRFALTVNVARLKDALKRIGNIRW